MRRRRWMSSAIVSTLLLLAAVHAFADPSPASLVKDINVLPSPGVLIVESQVFEIGGVGCFSGFTNTSSGLWRTDGTTAGTSLQVHVTPRQIPPPVEMNDTLYFVEGTSLWKTTDCTEAGTSVVATFSSLPGDLTNVNGTLF